MIYLRIETNGKILGIHAINKDIITLGRGPANTIAISDNRMSREHARIEVVNGIHTIIDLGSMNGVKLNGNTVKRAPLMDGDVFEIGNCCIVFSLTSEAGRSDDVAKSDSTPTQRSTQQVNRIRIEEPAPSANSPEARIARKAETMTTLPLGEVVKNAQQSINRSRVMVMVLEGIIQEATLSEFEKSIGDLVKANHNRLIVDMSEVTMVSAAGWAALVAGQKRLRESGGELKLACLRPKILQTFNALSLEKIIQNYASVKIAQEAF